MTEAGKPPRKPSGKTPKAAPKAKPDSGKAKPKAVRAKKAAEKKATPKAPKAKAAGKQATPKAAKPKAAKPKATGQKATPKAAKPKAAGQKATPETTKTKAGGKKAAPKAPKAKAGAGRAVSPPPRTTTYPPTLSEFDLHLFAEGRHRRVDELLGAHLRTLDGEQGTSFAVWAPGARRVSVVGDFCDWDPTRHVLRPLGTSGVHEGFIPGVGEGTLYKYELETAAGEHLFKSDPFGRFFEQPPGHASIVTGPARHPWGDHDWMSARAARDPLRSPLSIYEVHLGSWVRMPEEGNRHPGYREIAPYLARHVAELGFTHVELMPVMEHPFGGSWGYQVTGYFAPCSRYGSPDDFRFLVDTFHQAGLGVLLDWVPAHFPDDEHALARFDGTALFEHEDPRRGKHPDWDTLIFNYGRNEVACFLMASALSWLREYHIDGLRVDAVASMLHRDFSREPGEWVPNEEGGREDWDAVAFLQALNTAVREEFPGVMTIAEESTSWKGVTRDVADGGLGFHFKWNMGWMHDTLAFFGTDPLHRKHHHQRLTFAMMYEDTETFLMPLSHDEVVHGKGSLLSKMAGDEWQRLANLRCLLAYQFTRRGKQLLFMGTELASHAEWNHDSSLDWHLADQPDRQGLRTYLKTLATHVRDDPCYWRSDPDGESLAWIECDDTARSVFAYLRRDGEDLRVVILNTTPIPRDGVRLGMPRAGAWQVVLDSDAPAFGGSGYRQGPDRLETDAIGSHGHPQSLSLSLPPLGALVLRPAGG